MGTLVPEQSSEGSVCVCVCVDSRGGAGEGKGGWGRKGIIQGRESLGFHVLPL